MRGAHISIAAKIGDNGVCLLCGGPAPNSYIEHNGNLFHKICNYWYEVGTKFDDCDTTFVEFSTKYNPEVIKYRP